MGLPRFAVVDVETSGLRPRRHRVLQIGLVVVELQPADAAEPARVVERWSTLVRLRWPWNRVGPAHVHGLTRGRLRGAPRDGEALAELARRVDGAVLTAHNAPFDLAFLHRAARRAGVDLPLDPSLCTLELSRRLDPDRRLAHGLADVCARYAVPLDDHHDALADATATAAVLPHLLRAHHITDPAHLEPLLRARPAAVRPLRRGFGGRGLRAGAPNR